MHHCQTKKSKNFWGGGTDPPPNGRGIPPPRPHPLGAFGASILAPSALGVPVPFHLRLEHWADVLSPSAEASSGPNAAPRRPTDPKVTGTA